MSRRFLVKAHRRTGYETDYGMFFERIRASHHEGKLFNQVSHTLPAMLQGQLTTIIRNPRVVKPDHPYGPRGTKYQQSRLSEKVYRARGPCSI